MKKSLPIKNMLFDFRSHQDDGIEGLKLAQKPINSFHNEGTVQYVFAFVFSRSKPLNLLYD